MKIYPIEHPRQMDIYVKIIETTHGAKVQKEKYSYWSFFMLSQGLVFKDGRVLMVRQHVQRGDIVWNFPGGGIHEGETPEVACIREIKEETGYEVKIIELLYKDSTKFTFLAEIIGGTMFINRDMKENEDILDVSWVSIDDKKLFPPR